MPNASQIDVDFDGLGDACDDTFDLRSAVPRLVADLDRSLQLLLTSPLSKTLAAPPQLDERNALIQRLVFGVRNPTLGGLSLLGNGVINADRFGRRLIEVERHFASYDRELTRLRNLHRFPAADAELLQNLRDSVVFQLSNLRENVAGK